MVRHRVVVQLVNVVRVPLVDWSHLALSVDLETFNGGVLECCAEKGPTGKEILEQHPVLGDVAGEYVAQFKATVVIQPSKTVIIAGGANLTDRLDSGMKLDAETTALVEKGLWERPKKEKK